MPENLEFPELLRLLGEQAATLRATIASAPALDVKVPTCPEWTLLDLVRHMAEVQSFWAAVADAGPADTPPGSPSDFVDAAPDEREALLAWSAAATQRLRDSLRAAGPDAACWTWWDTSDSPQTAGVVARHQLLEMSVHTYDAQNAVGAPLPLPTDVALDSIPHFLSTCCANSTPWPHEPAALEFQASEGRSWRLTLSADGAHHTRVPASATMTAGTTAVRGTASELVMVLYSRLQITDLTVDGDPHLFELLRDWEPD
ncbi:protein of unknown function DUF1503 [Catenulispora acidiphila DSM 44928]|uniref:Mycothiol-dependent maleylpyruvate isomerase metal-binding domain-containing protein n=1 Tax=Catenulispora acidiphila (strain DSM 44928 / JCM 14897 / NBRC 102108 / NRRL B-24433 / ID139908) TaxID=479433 RepID=C7Q6A8_CATAD|nr:maleylpyruvate isomerase family mycothiol-dependent enzyme [Catenulispora acidiphila]ACU72114.1 protein of unknown function DUF1503 [Catenulispora acidiphila DSM 44928]